MYTATKEFNFAMSHRLEEHKGLCNNVHGHNYKLLVTVSRKKDELIKKSENISSAEMITDFTDLKNMVNEIIVDKFDHAFVYNENDKISQKIANFLISLIGQKVLPLPCRTTAEAMSQWIYFELNEQFKSLDIECDHIKLYETDKSIAEYNQE